MANRDETDKITQRTAEADLLLLCARTKINESILDRIRLKLDENIDWNYLTDLALAHRILPLVYWSLNEAYPEKVPPQALQRLQRLADNITRRNLFLAGMLANLLREFDQNNIPVIPYKGPVLAESAYGTISLRQFGDLDLLVREEDAQKAIELLRSLAYRQTGDQQSWQTHLVRQDSLVGIDLHWRLTAKHLAFPIIFEQLWARLRPVTIANMEIQGPSLEDSLIIRCQDAMGSYFKPGWPELHWICDVAELAGQEELDWDDVVLKVQRLRSQSTLYVCLLLANELLGTTLPPEIWRRAESDPQVRALLQIANQRLFHEDERQLLDPHQPLLRRHMFALRTKELLPLPASWTFPVMYRVASIFTRLRPN